MRLSAGVALALSVLAGCFSDTTPHLTGAGPTDGTSTATGDGATATSTATSTSTSTSSSTSSTTSSATGPDDPTTAATTTGTCPMGQVRPWYVDADSDGYGAGEPVAVDCVGPPGAVDVPGDCDDGAVGVHPGAVELCNKLIDDDCDGLRDEYSAQNLECELCSLAASATATFWACSSDIDFTAAEAACQSHGMAVHLANPADALETALVLDLALQRFVNPPTSVDFWLGIHRPMDLWNDCNAQPGADGWQSVDGSPITYLVWKGGEPNNDNCSNFCEAVVMTDPLCRRENCIEIDDPQSGGYNDSFCDSNDQDGYVCKAPL